MVIDIYFGSTGVGKTKRATEKAHLWNSPVVVVDRIQAFDDLAVISGRPTTAEIHGTQRHYLDHRRTCAGDYGAEQAYADLCTVIADLRRSHKKLILEGGSISLWNTMLRYGIPYDAICTWNYCAITDMAVYRTKVAQRVNDMLDGQDVWTEVANVCQCDQSQAFARTVVGYQPVVNEIQARSPIRAGIGMVESHLCYATEQRTFFESAFIPWLARRGQEVSVWHT